MRHGLAERGLRNGYVTVDNYDGYMDALVQRAVAARREAGWQIVPAETAYADPIADMLPDTLFNGPGRVAALAHAAGLKPAREMVPPFEDEAWLEAEFTRRGVFSGGD